MSTDILKPINSIKTSINENDQVLWKCQASAKCYNEASEKLKEECRRLNKELAIIEEEIREVVPQTEILSSCYEIQVECLILNQQSLISERLYKKCVFENNKKHQDEVRRTIDEYSQHFERCKQKLEITNPMYKLLQTKRTELKKCKIHCLDLTKKLNIMKESNKKKVDIRERLFIGDVVVFAKFWLKRKRYVEITIHLNKEKHKERQYMRKLVEVTEQLKRKQKGGCYRKDITFNIPQIEFSTKEIANDVKSNPGKVKKQVPSPFSDIKNLLENKEFSLTDVTKVNKENSGDETNLRSFQFNANNSKIRILENKTLNLSHEKENSLIVLSKEARSKAITEKLQKVVQNINKSISRQNSKNLINVASLTPFQSSKQVILNKNSSQYTNASQERNTIKMDVDQNMESNSTGTSQDLLNLSIDNRNNNSTIRQSQDSNKNNSQLPNDNHKSTSNINVHRRKEVPVDMNTSLFFTKPNLQESRFSQGIASATVNQPVNNFIFNEKNKTNAINVSRPSRVNEKFTSSFGETSQFFPGFGNAFSAFSNNTSSKDAPTQVVFKKPECAILEKQKAIDLQMGELTEPTSFIQTGNNKPPENTQNISDSKHESNKNVHRGINDEDKAKPENLSTENKNVTKMGEILTYNFGNDTQFQILNESNDYDKEYTSEQFDQNYISSLPAEDTNTPINFENQTGFSSQLFSFQSNNPFSFK